MKRQKALKVEVQQKTKKKILKKIFVWAGYPVDIIHPPSCMDGWMTKTMTNTFRELIQRMIFDTFDL